MDCRGKAGAWSDWEGACRLGQQNGAEQGLDRPRLLWVDQRFSKSSSDLYASVSSHYPAHRVSKVAAIPEAIHGVVPQLICFDYDCPDPSGLRALQQTKLEHPSLPILMLTEYHSEALAVWAFRSSVRDYFVKPVPIEELAERIETLARLSRVPKGGEATRSNPILNQPMPMSDEQLCHWREMKAIGMVAGGVAHDLSNLLTGIMGFSELVLNSLEHDSPLYGHVEQIRKAGERAATLTHQLAALGRTQAPAQNG